MPIPPIPVIGLAPTLHVAKVATHMILNRASSASLAAVLIRLAWNRIPDWIKADLRLLDWMGLSNNDSDDINGKEDEEEMERLSLVIEKLQSFMVAACAKCDVTAVPNLYASLLVYIQLSAQLKLREPQERDSLYHHAGDSIFSGVGGDRFRKNTGSFEAREELRRIRVVLDYAIWAYFVDDDAFLSRELDPVGFCLLDRFVPTRPGYVGYYLAISHAQKVMMIGIKGTSSLEEIFTDMSGQPVSLVEEGAMSQIRIEVCDEGQVVVESWDHENDNSIRCHEGIFISAQRLAKQVEQQVEKIVVRGGYKLLITGHSLGASAACLLAVLLRSKFHSLTEDNLEVVAFAPPPVLDHDSAIAAMPYITSIVNNGDVITRTSLSNLAVFLEFLRVVSDKINELGLTPTGPVSTTYFFKMLSQGEQGNPLFSLQEVRSQMKQAYTKVQLRHPDHLYVPGRVLLLHQDSKPLSDKEFFCTVTDGTAKVLRFVDVDGLRMLSDHSTDAYAHVLDALCTNNASI